jgi:cysteinyl-tRNA synthetase
LTIRGLLAEWPGEVLRLNMLRTHYRQPIDWTANGLHESQRVLDDWYHVIGSMEPAAEIMPDHEVMSALCDDLNTPNVLTRLHALVNDIRASASGSHQTGLKRRLKASGVLMGLLDHTEEEYLKGHPRRMTIDESKIKNLLDARAHARKARNFAQADTIRAELADMGVEIEDRKDGTTTWKMKRKAS